MSRWILTAANALVNLVVILFLSVAGIYAAYALWDNSRVYTAASDVQADMVKIKPAVEEEGGASFEELLAINRDVYGNFALAGSIFLDTRNQRDFSDAYCLLYGHHMENSGMFGDLDFYKEQSFFDDNKTGMLILPDRTYNLEIFACLLVEAGEDAIFDPELWQTDINGLLSFAEENSLHLRKETIENVKQAENPKILALSTCSTEFTDARTIILAVMEPYQTAV